MGYVVGAVECQADDPGDVAEESCEGDMSEEEGSQGQVQERQAYLREEQIRRKKGEGGTEILKEWCGGKVDRKRNVKLD